MTNEEIIARGGGSPQARMTEGWRNWLAIPDETICPNCGLEKAWDEDICPACRLAEEEER